jgi:N-acetylmuramoyl-L-alanine amidase
MSNRFFPNYDSYIITSRFGVRKHPVTGVTKMHNGIDLTATNDGIVGQADKIMAHTGGVVDGVGFDKDAGNYVNIRVSLDTVMVYYHMRDPSSLVPGDVVKTGDIIGIVGQTGKASGKHLHFGIKENGNWIDPEPYLDKDYVQEGGNSMSNKTICLDAGHYGKYNRSPVVKEYYESEMNWKLHLLLKKYLEQYGFRVITTRASKDKDLAVYTRGTASKGCDLFLSIHSNASGTESVDYPLAIVPLNGSGDAVGNKLAECIAATMGTKQKGKIASKKGSNGDYYGVIRGAVAVGVPGLILEHSFHTNTKATKWLLNDSNLDKLAKAEAKVLADHYGMTKEEFTPYLVKITASVLNVRAGAGTSYKVNTTVKKGEVYTIVTEDGSWGKLKSGAGWISLDYCSKV